MSAATPSSRPAFGHRVRCTVAGLAVVTALSGALTATPASAGPRSAEQAAATGDVRAIQANIKSDLSVERFQADVREVLSYAPDVVTYNEVPLRMDWVIAPEGYDVYRDMRNRYTKATAVAWRSDRWTAIATGTIRVSNYRKIPPGRNIKLGLRYANWATLQGVDGRTMSVVAAHVAPLDKNMPDLLRRSVRRIGELVEELSASGPVLVGGDFNVHYKSGRYPRDLLEPVGMVPTYDTLASFFPTGDHQGMTIDYVFNRGAEALGATAHAPVELYSDHDAVVTDFDWLTDTTSDTRRLVSDPDGDETAQRLAVDAVAGAVGDAEPGESVAMVTSGLDLFSVFRKLRAAVGRGVVVDYVTRGRTLTPLERRLARVVAAGDSTGSSVSRCRGGCLDRWREADFPRTFLLHRDGDGEAVLRVDASRTVSSVMLRKRTVVKLQTGEVALREGREMLARLG